MYSLLQQIISRQNIAVDLGTANTRIGTPEGDQMMEEPSMVNHIKNRATADRDDYISYLNSNFVTMPLRGGVIVDYENAIKLLRPLVKKTVGSLRHPVSLACAPSDTSERERDLLSNALLRAGASRVTIVPEVWAAAIGAGLDVMSPCAQAVIDIGEGVTDMAVVQGGRLRHFAAVRTACSDLQKAIRTSVMAKHQVYLFKEEIEKLLDEIISLCNGTLLLQRFLSIEGIHVIKRCKVRLDINSMDIRISLENVIRKILMIIRRFFEKLPERSYEDVVQLGVCLTGGGACIRGIDTLVALETNLDVKIAPDPTHSVINGAVRVLKDLKEKGDGREQVSWCGITGQPG